MAPFTASGVLITVGTTPTASNDFSVRRSKFVVYNYAYIAPFDKFGDGFMRRRWNLNSPHAFSLGGFKITSEQNASLRWRPS